MLWVFFGGFIFISNFINLSSIDKNALDIEKYVKNLCKARVRDNDTVDEVEDAGVIEA